MRMSTRGRYTLRALLDLALHTDQGPVLRQEIAARQEISADYVAQLFQPLCAVGLVKGVKGPGGGYLLARDPATIRVGDVIRAVEGPIAAVRCVVLSPPTCRRAASCTTRMLWVRLSEAVAQFLDAITLKELCDQARQLNPGVASHCDTVETLVETAGRLPSINNHCALLAEEMVRAARRPFAAGVYTYDI